MTSILAQGRDEAVPILLTGPERLEETLAGLDDGRRRFATAQGFKAEAGKHVALPDAEGRLAVVLFGLGPAGSAERTPLLTGRLAQSLPEGVYRLEGDVADPRLSALGFALGGYRFERYRKAGQNGPRLVAPASVKVEEIDRIADAVRLARDLVNTPANDLGPQEIARAARDVATRFGASVAILEGERLGAEYPMVQAVGAASDRPPCLIDLVWGGDADPKVTLVGKGVAFDTGGLDIKPAASMALMKKDMGGAANVLALAQMIMGANLPVRLRVLVPAVENAISGRAFRPGDVLRSRKGLTVEIGNTDAEGRLILADALAAADEEAPDLLVSMATLTGAARVALGPDLPPFYTEDDDLARRVHEAGAAEFDPVWRLPLWKPYDAWLASKVADLNHISNNAFAGSIVAALFLKRFVGQAKRFVHFDIFAWNQTAKPHGPEGGEAQAIRALDRLLGAGGLFESAREAP